MSNNNGYGNEFMDTIVQNNDLSKKNSVPEVQHVVMLYAKNLYDNTADELSGWKKGLAFLLRIVHIFGIFFICSGWLLPSKLLILHILFCLKTLFLWKIFNGKCYMSMYTNNLIGKKYSELVPMNIEICKSLVLVVMIMSLQGILFPKQSYFRILENTVDFLKNFK